MARQAHLNAKNPEALWAARLADLLRLALAEQKGPAEIAREVRKRLATIERSASFLDDLQRDRLLKDLERQRCSGISSAWRRA